MSLLEDFDIPPDPPEGGNQPPLTPGMNKEVPQPAGDVSQVENQENKPPNFVPETPAANLKVKVLRNYNFEYLHC